jgi:hypothetical protein
MNLTIRTGAAVVCAMAISAACAQIRPADPAIPHLEKRGLATQLIVDGKPFLILGAEPPTSAPSNLVYLRYMLSVLAATHQDTAAIAVGWGRRLPVWPSRKRAGLTTTASGWRRISSAATIPFFPPTLP